MTKPSVKYETRRIMVTLHWAGTIEAAKMAAGDDRGSQIGRKETAKALTT